MSWPHWFFLSVPDELVGLLLITAASFLLIMGLVSVAAARVNRRTPSVIGARRWYQRLDFRTGLFMLGEGALYLLLAAILLIDGEGLDLWQFVFLLTLGVIVLYLFEGWAKERKS